MFLKKIDKDFLLTTSVRLVIMLLNFLVVILTTHFWGQEGRGYIAIFVADISLIATFTNILTNSSVSFFLKKVGHSPLATLAFLWTFIVSAIAALAIFVVGNTSGNFAILIFAVAVFSGCITFHSSLFLGIQKIFHYNVVTLLMSLLQLTFVLLFRYLFPSIGYYAFFFAQFAAYFIVLFVCVIFRNKLFGKTRFSFNINIFKQSFSFGWQEELAAFMQFLNARLCFYLIGIYANISSVGIFSIGVTLAESIWVFSRSMALVHYSRVLKIGNSLEAWLQTKKVIFYAVMCSIISLIAACIVPESIYELIFGEGFGKAKFVVIMLSIGIVAHSCSHVIFNYFSALGLLKILLAMATAGLVVTSSLAFWLIPKFNINGACIVNSISYLASCSVLIFFFVRQRKKIN